MGTRSGCRAMVVGVLAVTLLAGCVPSETDAAPVPEPSPTPVFASDDEALAAATEAYERYLKVSDEIMAEGGANPDRISKVVMPEHVADERETFAIFSEDNLYIEGNSAFDSMSLQSYEPTREGRVVVIVYVCSDITNIQVKNDAGLDVTPTRKTSRVPLEVSFSTSAPGSTELLMMGGERWSGNDFC